MDSVIKNSLEHRVPHLDCWVLYLLAAFFAARACPERVEGVGTLISCGLGCC
jgi:hypothetical protein